MDNFVPEEYRIVVYLDTNILVDYAISQNDMLIKTLKWMHQCPFVTLHSSRYVEFELTEVLKYLYFYRHVNGKFPIDGTYKFEIRNSNWILGGVDYTTVMADVINDVKEAKNRILEDLNIDYAEHPLEDSLLMPTLDICLKTKISKEDCLVLASGSDNGILFFALLSNDKQFSQELTASNTVISPILNKHKKCSPENILIKDLHEKNGKQINLVHANLSDEELSALWASIVLDLIRKKNESRYLGETYQFGNKGMSEQCVYFELTDAYKALPLHNSLYFVDNSLKDLFVLSDLSYWNNGEVVSSLPHVNNVDGKYSFLPSKIEPEILRQLRQEGNLVFLSVDE